jgi:Ca-activated chloride channel homolog
VAPPAVTGEQYAERVDNRFVSTLTEPLSTFSIDVDTGSYSNVRRMLNAGVWPPREAVRTEEMLNYFDYQYPAAHSLVAPFSVHTESAAAPWNNDHELLMVGIKGYQPEGPAPAANLVFLVDVSGSMMDEDKLPLIKSSLRQLVAELRAEDQVSLVVYAGAAGLVLPPTSGADKSRILGALDQLEAGGSTAGGEGLALAYATAKKSFAPGGINRVLLLTDGDFNVGVSDVDGLKTMVSDYRNSGIALSTFGFGTGNYNDEMAEQLANVGNGQYSYIDSSKEADKVFRSELRGNMLTIAKDVKLQLAFDPAVVKSYRLLGYENRVLANEDFRNDAVDAGEIGAGHDVTAIYELQFTPRAAATHSKPGFGRISFRYKEPTTDSAREFNLPLVPNAAARGVSQQFQWAIAVVSFAEVLRSSEGTRGLSLTAVHSLAKHALGPQPDPARSEMLGLIERAARLKPVE